MSKASEAFRNIGEVSVELGIKKHVLRFWETKFPQLKPMKRGGGRRLYRPADVQLLRGIRDLLQGSGYTIKGVQKILREQGVDHVKKAPGSSPDEEELRAQTTHAPGAVLRLDATEVEALRKVMAELDACHSILASARQREPGGQRLKRPSSRG